jgi:hypothetical protein
MSESLPPRPKPAYGVGCALCEHHRLWAAIGCTTHRTPAERLWFAEVERIAAAPTVPLPIPTLF